MEKSKLLSKPAGELSDDRLAELINATYTGYVGGELAWTAELMKEFCGASLVSFPLGHVFFSPDKPDEPVALALIAVRDDKPGEVRLVAIGVIPAYRGKGVASQALKMVIQAEKDRGTKLMELEVIQTNTSAIALYKRAGFTVLRDLAGWERDSPPGATSAEANSLQECTIAEVDTIVRAHAADNLPWQAWGFRNTPYADRSFRLGHAFKLGHAYCAISDPNKEDNTIIRLQALIVEPEWRGQGEATRLIEALMASFPGKKWRATAIFPREYGESLARRLGFEKAPIGQFQMRLKLD